MDIAGAAHVRPIRIDQIFQRQAGVDELLHFVVAKAINVTIDPRGVVGHFIEHAAIGVGEPGIVLEEIAMGVNVRDDQLLVGEFIRPQQVGVTGIGVDNHLVDLLQTIRIALH